MEQDNEYKTLLSPCSDNAYFVLNALVLISDCVVSCSVVRELLCGLAMGPLATCPLALNRDLRCA